MARKRDLTNEQFGRLTAIEETDLRDAAGNVIWKCVCDCGNEKFVYVPSRNLISGNTKSCGCLAEENMRRIGEKQIGKNTSIYRKGGFSYNKNRNNWQAYITVNKNKYYLGSFKEKDEAVRIRKEAEKAEESGEFFEWYKKMKQKSKGEKNN